MTAEVSFNVDVAGGVILAGGVPVTEGNIDSLLDISVLGDFDDDDVDGNDFLVWQRGDANAADLALWQQRFGHGNVVTAAAVGSVPEPASIVLLGLGSLLVLGIRQRLNYL